MPEGHRTILSAKNTGLPIPTAILNALDRRRVDAGESALPRDMSQIDEKRVLTALAPIRNREFGGDSIVSLGQVADGDPPERRERRP